MLKAIAITKFESDFGALTVALTEENEIYFRAHEAAKLFGFSDTKSCLSQHVKNSELILMPTRGGMQHVKCINWDEVIHIGFKSRLKDKEDLLFELSHFHKCVKIDVLERENAELRSLLADSQKTLHESIAQTKEVLNLADDYVRMIQDLLDMIPGSMNS